MVLLAVRDLRYRWLRLAITAITVAVVFAVVFVLAGIDEGVAGEPGRTLGEFGDAAAYVVAEGVPGFLAATSILPDEVLHGLRDGGHTAWGLVVARSTVNGADVIAIGTDHVGSSRLGVLVGTPPASDDQVVVSRTLGTPTGTSLVLGGERFDVVGQTGDASLFAGVPLVFVSTAAAQQLGYSGQPVLNAVALADAADEVPVGTAMRTPAQVEADAVRPVASASGTLRGLALLMYLIGGAVIGAVVYLSALERRRDFAVLKAVGLPNGILAGGLVIQSLLVTGLALGLATALQAVLGPLFPLPVVVPSVAYLIVPTVAFGAALVASIGGVVQAVRVEPALAFASAGA